jgi:Holliday junction resolvasome RuvABC DNA-binding subunit
VLAERALVQMGFRGGEVHGAIRTVKERHGDSRASVAPATAIREALALLT